MAGPGSDNCSSHAEMMSNIKANHVVLMRVEKNITDLYNKNDKVIEKIGDTTATVIKKLGDMELHFVTKGAERDRRKIDGYKKTGWSLLKTIMCVIAASAGGGSAYKITESILKLWR